MHTQIDGARTAARMVVPDGVHILRVELLILSRILRAREDPGSSSHEVWPHTWLMFGSFEVVLCERSICSFSRRHGTFVLTQDGVPLLNTLGSSSQGVSAAATCFRDWLRPPFRRDPSSSGESSPRSQLPIDTGTLGILPPNLL